MFTHFCFCLSSSSNSVFLLQSVSLLHAFSFRSATVIFDQNCDTEKYNHLFLTIHVFPLLSHFSPSISPSLFLFSSSVPPPSLPLFLFLPPSLPLSLPPNCRRLGHTNRHRPTASSATMVDLQRLYLKFHHGHLGVSNSSDEAKLRQISAL